MQVNYTFTDLDGVQRSAAYWADAVTPGQKLLIIAGRFVLIRRTITKDRTRGVKTEWVQAV